MRGEIASYIDNNWVNPKQYESFGANRSLATKIFAERLGIPELIPQTTLCELHIDHIVLFGTIMEDVGSQNTNDLLFDNHIIYTKSFFREISNLEYLDALCFQLDHRKSNYRVKLSEHYAVGVSAFDNDCARTFGVSCALPQRTYNGCSSVIDGRFAQTYISRPYADILLYKKLCNLTKQEIYHSLAPYLNKLQLFSLWKRILKLRQAMCVSAAQDAHFLVDFDAVSTISFNKETMQLSIDDVVYNMQQYKMNYLIYNLTVDEHLKYLKSLTKNTPQEN